MLQTNVPEINAWIERLREANKSENTLRAYSQRVLHFAEWFESTIGELLTPERVTPTDLREYKSYLIINLKRTPSTVNLSFVAIAN
ncbi:phage integrase N-terminal SAM-like domain-containing protein [Desulfosporosinus nitroreducens]|uniref:phage integrase N-terminal SAM-like domain-containing protein n=1 Tax=Desulfosporosinus nitroreducens TaxID=2018668 RepID=UPI00207C64BE|nr:phage integrase N-terminal SAM-like domain-containing protein [Desulfosporosinus nitroreducens]MCO1601598.1 phage integrase N-terminal SAM-like domain-containing protein [Desulfosporosinus nitroreducens]